MNKKSFTHKHAFVGTHVPVLQSIIEIFHPSSVIELGSGMYSTPIFVDSCDRVVSVETDVSWYKKLVTLYRKNNNTHVLLHNISNDDIVRYVEDENVEKIRDFYQALKRKYNDIDLLFVDQRPDLRTLSLQIMYDQFSFIVWHDAQKKGYNYDLFYAKDLTSYNRYMLDLLGIQTGLLIHKTKSYDENTLRTCIDKYCSKYIKKYVKNGVDVSEPKFWRIDHE